MPDAANIEKGKEFEFLLSEAVSRAQRMPPSEESAKLLSAKAADLTTEDAGKLQQRASAALESIAANPRNEAAGKLSARVGNRHQKVRKLIEETASSLFFLGLAASVEPTGLSLFAAFERGVEMIRTFAGLLDRLSDTEIFLYDIIADIDGRNKFPSINTDLKRGTEQDIRDVITKERKKALPNDFKIALAALSTTGKIKSEAVEGLSEPVYHVVF